MRYYIKQKVFSFKDKFKVTDENQNELYQVEGKVFSIHNKLNLLNMDGSTVYQAQKKVFNLLGKYFLFDPHGEEIAEITRKFSLRPKLEVRALGKEYTVEGSLFAHNFFIQDEGKTVASINKKVISWGDSYEIEINNDNQKELFLFIVIIIDQMMHEKKNRNRGFDF